ncbi:MAG: fatty acid desaturase [Pseudomonadota bacterium]
MLNRGQAWCEWPTWALIASVTLCWCLVTAFAAEIGIALSILLLVPLITLHSSLQHETVHILEPRWPILSKTAIFPAVGLLIPYIRFRDQHLAHHDNEKLTDPYDDPETYYLEPSEWQKHSWLTKLILEFNNTLLGRLIVGPMVGQVFFIKTEWVAYKTGDRQIGRAWAWHLPAIALVFGWLFLVGTLPIWAYLIAAYLGLSVLKIRTFLEHQAHEDSNHRSVIVENGGIFGFLFLNNNLHHAHHTHPQVPWYALPQLFQDQKDKFLVANGGYRYGSYWDVFKGFFFRAKEPVPHPIWSKENRTAR